MNQYLPQDLHPPTQANVTLLAASTDAWRDRSSNRLSPDLLATLDRLKFFLATAPSQWAEDADPSTSSDQHTPALNRFLLPNGDHVSCVFWNGLYHITGTDIVRALVFRFEAFGRPVRNYKKFEEGIFSDLRNLKPGIHSTMEDAKSPFLDLLFKNHCIRTQKKQKVFYWFSVDHDRLFLDALERDLKREKLGQEPTTEIVGEPARSFTYDPRHSLYEQFRNARGGQDGEEDLERLVREAEENLPSLQQPPQYEPPTNFISNISHPSSTGDFRLSPGTQIRLGKRSASDDLSGTLRRFELGDQSGDDSPDRSPSLGAALGRHPSHTFKRRRRRTVTDKISRKASSQSVPTRNTQHHASSYRTPAPGYVSDMAVSDVASDAGYASSTFSEYGQGHHGRHQRPGSLQYTQYSQGTPPDNGHSVQNNIPHDDGFAHGHFLGPPIESHRSPSPLPLVCPISTCQQTFNSREEMLPHLQRHTIESEENSTQPLNTQLTYQQNLNIKDESPDRDPPMHMISHLHNSRDVERGYPGRHDVSRFQSPGQVEYSSRPYPSNNRFSGRPKTAVDHHHAVVSSSERFMDHNIQSSPTYSNRSYDSVATTDAIPQYSPMGSDPSLYGTRLDSPLHVSQSTPSLTGILPPSSNAVSAPATTTGFPAPSSIWKTGLRQLKEVPLRRFRSSASLFPRNGVLGRRNPLNDTTDGSRPMTAQPLLRAPASVNRDITARPMTADSYYQPSSQGSYAPPPYAPSRDPPSRTSPGYVAPSEMPHSNRQSSPFNVGLTLRAFPSLDASQGERSSYSSPKSASGYADYNIARQIDSGRSSLSSLQPDDLPSANHPTPPQSDMYLVSNVDHDSPSSTNNETRAKVAYHTSTFVSPYSYPNVQHISAYEGHLSAIQHDPNL